MNRLAFFAHDNVDAGLGLTPDQIADSIDEIIGLLIIACLLYILGLLIVACLLHRKLTAKSELVVEAPADKSKPEE